MSHLQREQTELSHSKGGLSDNIITKVQQVEQVKADNPNHFHKIDGKLTDSSVLARESRKRVQQLKAEIKEIEKNVQGIDKEINQNKALKGQIQADIQKVHGPFMTKFQKVSDHLHIAKQAYHGGSLIGPDVHRMLNNHKMFADIFLPIDVDTDTGFQIFGSQDLSIKIETMFQKFKSCYDLYNMNRMLCKHEVELLVLKCSEYGYWFPVNFPNSNLQPISRK